MTEGHCNIWIRNLPFFKRHDTKKNKARENCWVCCRIWNSSVGFISGLGHQLNVWALKNILYERKAKLRGPNFTITWYFKYQYNKVLLLVKEITHHHTEHNLNFHPRLFRSECISLMWFFKCNYIFVVGIYLFPLYSQYCKWSREEMLLFFC